jgi:hypothetical protein
LKTKSKNLLSYRIFVKTLKIISLISIQENQRNSFSMTMKRKRKLRRRKESRIKLNKESRTKTLDPSKDSLSLEM